MAESNRFLDALNDQNAADSVAVTEKGALGFARTKSHLVDFFFHIGSMRSWSNDRIQTDFSEAYAENSQRAIELMFLARDCRGGMGEKKVFNACFDWLVRNFPGDAIDVIGLIPEYGSWKTFFDLTDIFRKDLRVEAAAKELFSNQWKLDIELLRKRQATGYSLMAKWAPSENTSSKETRKRATYWRQVIALQSAEYRKSLSSIRSKLNVVEQKMAAGNWSEINYNAVPAKAGMIYKCAFLKHDEARRRMWLAELQNNTGDAKINVSGLTVADLVSSYMEKASNGYGYPNISLVQPDPTIEAAWREMVAKGRAAMQNLPNMIPVVDGSGSMYDSGTTSNKIRPIHVSMGLGLYLANINKGSFQGKIIEYGERPEFFSVPTEATLLDQLKIAIKHDDCGTTNIEAVFDLILDVANKEHLRQEEIPQLICFSDMEFDYAMCMNPRGWGVLDQEKLFETISKKFSKFGYFLPKIFFWNICNRSGAIPMIENELGVGLLSGYSQAIMDMVLSRKLDPLDILLERLNSKRYDPVRKALASR